MLLTSTIPTAHPNDWVYVINDDDIGLYVIWENKYYRVNPNGDTKIGLVYDGIPEWRNFPNAAPLNIKNPFDVISYSEFNFPNSHIREELDSLNANKYNESRVLFKFVSKLIEATTCDIVVEPSSLIKGLRDFGMEPNGKFHQNYVTGGFLFEEKVEAASTETRKITLENFLLPLIQR